MCSVISESTKQDWATSVEVFTLSENKVDNHIYNYIIPQKDIIIQDLRDNFINNILNTHIDRLNKYLSKFNKDEQKPKEINPVSRGL